MITISVILKRLRILHHVSNAPDVTNYGLIVPHVIDSTNVIDMKIPVVISANMNSSVVIAKRLKTYSRIYPNDPNKNKFFDYYITYDFETILSKIEDKRTETLSFTNKHLPVSFSLFSNIPGYDKDPIFVCHNDVKKLIDIFVKTLVDISVKSYEINLKKYSDVLDYLDRQINISIHEKDKNKDEHKYHKFMKWLREVAVVGFNSVKYDVNIMKLYLSGSLTKYDKPDKEEVTPLKTNNMYSVITSKTLKFL